jgi:aspartyl-tRNA(Asn)/glutamyl-tRNA(Gln) amidotransferase subunit A
VSAPSLNAPGALTRLPVRDMAAGLRAGTFTARELVDAHLRLAHRQNRALNAWVFFDDERALEAAGRADARFAEARRDDALDRLPLLLGIPVALKDLVVTRGRPSTAGSRILGGFVGTYDAFIAERLDAAGAIVLGKTNMDEFAMGTSTEHSAWGPTSNPWDLGRVPGGSSGGSAASRTSRPNGPIWSSELAKAMIP